MNVENPQRAWVEDIILINIHERQRVSSHRLVFTLKSAIRSISSSVKRVVLGSLLGCCVASGLVDSIVLADEPADFLLESNQWTQLTIPSSASNVGVRQLMSGELSAEAYGSNWIVYLFDAETGTYRDPGIEGQIPFGTGFWIIQTTDSAVTLTYPDNLPQTGIQNSAACSNATGCTAVSIVSKAGQSTYNMVGSALMRNVPVSQIRIQTQTDSSICYDGCSLEMASDAQFVSHSLWHYDSGNNNYKDLVITGSINAWQAVWLLTLPPMPAGEAHLLFPEQAVQSNCATSSGFAGDDGLKRWCWSDLATEINSLTDQSFIDNARLFTSVHHYPDDLSSYKPVEVVGDQLVFTVSPGNPLSTRISPFSGERSAWNYRSEIRDSPSDVDHPNGTEQWWGFHYSFADDYIIDDLPWIMWQTHANESTPVAPMQALEVASANYGGAENVRGEIVIANNVFFSSTGSTRSRTRVIPQAGQVLKVVIQLVWGTESTGQLRVWLDDALVYDEQQRTSYPEHEEGGYWKAGIYKWRWQKESNIQISESLGITRLQTSLGPMRVIKNDPGDAAYLTDQYALVDPARE